MERRIISDEALLNYLDGQLSTTDRVLIKDKIKNDLSVQQRIKELEAIHVALFNQSGLENPSKNFTEKVMANLHVPVLPYFFPVKGLMLLIWIVDCLWLNTFVTDLRSI